MSSSRPEKLLAGWREWISLPDLGIDFIKTKIDTGARTSALHAFRARRLRRRRSDYVQFYVHPVQRHRTPEVQCTAPLIDERVVISSNGSPETRYVIETELRIGANQWPIEVTLTDRDEMSFRMLLGRQALQNRLIVDPGTSFKLPTSKHVRKKGP